MLDRRGVAPLLREPAGGAPVELGHLGAVLALELASQELGAQRVVAEPAVLVVERDEEQVRAGDAIEHAPRPRRSPVTSSHSSAQKLSSTLVCARNARWSAGRRPRTSAAR